MSWLLGALLLLVVVLCVRVEQLHASLHLVKELLMNGFDALQAAVTANTTVEQGAVVAIQGLAAKVEALKGTNPTDADLQALADSITANASALASAIAAVPPTDLPVGGSSITANASAPHPNAPSPTSTPAGPATIGGTGQ
jgi:hypothetical protein